MISDTSTPRKFFRGVLNCYFVSLYGVSSKPRRLSLYTMRSSFFFQKCWNHLVLPKLFEIPASGDKEILKKRVRISGSTQQIHVEMTYISPPNMDMQDLHQKTRHILAYKKVIEAYRTNSNKNGKHCYIEIGRAHV